MLTKQEQNQPISSGSVRNRACFASSGRGSDTYAEQIDEIRTKALRVYGSCGNPAPVAWATNAEPHMYDRIKAAERYQELAARRIKELEEKAA